MSTLGRRRIRILADVAVPPGTPLKDIFTSATPAVWRGNDLQFELAIGMSTAIIADIGNIASLTVSILSGPNPTDAALVSKTLTSAELTTITQEQWTARTHQHAVIPFTNAETSPALGAEKNKNFWVAISMVTNDVPGRDVTLGCTVLSIYEDGVGAEQTTDPQGAPVYTQQEADARFVPQHADLAFWQFRNGTPYGYEASTAKWYPLVVTIVDGIPVLTLGPGETL